MVPSAILILNPPLAYLVVPLSQGMGQMCLFCNPSETSYMGVGGPRGSEFLGLLQSNGWGKQQAIATKLTPDTAGRGQDGSRS